MPQPKSGVWGTEKASSRVSCRQKPHMHWGLASEQGVEGNMEEWDAARGHRKFKGTVISSKELKKPGSGGKPSGCKSCYVLIAGVATGK